MADSARNSVEQVDTQGSMDFIRGKTQVDEFVDDVDDQP